MSKFKTGESGNPNGRPPKKTPNQVLGTIVVNAAQGVPDLPIEKTKADKFTDTVGWIPFGSDNLFPQALALMARRSVVHRSIMYHKKNYVIPHQMICSNPEVLNYIGSVNANDEPLTEVLGKGYLDWQNIGNTYIEVVKYKLGGGKVGANLYHKDSTKCRVKDVNNSKDKTKGILYHPDWRKARNTQDLIVDYPLYPNFKVIDGQERSIYHFKDYESEYSDYGIPLWVSALDVAAITWKTNKWNVSRLDNTFHSSGVMVVEGDYSPEDVEVLKKEIDAAYSGEDNQGKLAIIIKQLGGGSTTITPFTTNMEGDWTQLHTQANKDLVSAHVWQRSLCNMSDAAQLGNTTLIRNEYGLATRIIKNDQMFFLKRIAKILKDVAKMDASTLDFVNISPVPITDLLDPKLVLTQEEQRRAFGYEPMSENQKVEFQKEQEVLKQKDGTNNSAANS